MSNMYNPRKRHEPVRERQNDEKTNETSAEQAGAHSALTRTLALIPALGRLLGVGLGFRPGVVKAGELDVGEAIVVVVVVVVGGGGGGVIVVVVVVLWAQTAGGGGGGAGARWARAERVVVVDWYCWWWECEGGRRRGVEWVTITIAHRGILDGHCGWVY